MVRSQRYNGRGRARTFGDRSWLGAAVARSALACVRQVKVDRKDVGMLSRRSVPAIVHTLGRMSQALGRIGANGFMVYRMRVACWPDAGSCRLQRKTRSREVGSFPTLNPFPLLIPTVGIRIFATVPSPPRAAADRPRGTVDRYYA